MDSEPLPATEDARGGFCLECGAELSGPFCARCGQEDRDAEPPAGEMLREMLADAVGADATVWRSLRLLTTRPGALTLEYLAGRRRRYLSPLRLYLMASIPFVALAVWTPAGQSLIQVQPPQEFAGRVQDFREALFDVWPWFLVAVLPLFAAVYALLLRRVHASFTRHLVFTLHLHAFGLVALSVSQLVWYVPPRLLGALMALACMVAPVGYLVLSLRRVYGISWVASVATTLGAAVLNVAVVGLSVLGAVVVTSLRLS